METDWYNGPDEFTRLDAINKMAYEVTNPTDETFRNWDYFLFLVQINKDTLIIRDHINDIKSDMMRVCPAYKDYQYKKLLEEKID